jgi:hypothetical protein
MQSVADGACGHEGLGGCASAQMLAPHLAGKWRARVAAAGARLSFARRSARDHFEGPAPGSEADTQDIRSSLKSNLFMHNPTFVPCARFTHIARWLAQAGLCAPNSIP